MLQAVLFSSLSLAASAASASASAGKDENHLAFLQWAKQFARMYDSDDAMNKAFDTWKQNLEVVKAINESPGVTWTASINTKFADMTAEEFRTKMFLRQPLDSHAFKNEVTKLNKRISPTTLKQLSSRSAVAGVAVNGTDASSFDWRDHGAVTAVKDQGTVGTCWAFSTVGNVEGQWFLADHPLTPLSEEFIVDCDGSHDDKHADCGVFGGWPYLAYGFVEEKGGLPTEQAYPYCAGTGDCYPCMQGPVSLCGPPPYYCDEEIEKEKCPSEANDLQADVKDWVAVAEDEGEMAQQLASIGPLSVLLDASQLQFYSSGVWNGYREGGNPLLGCSKQYLDHAVLAVGYGTDGGVDYWSVKNSWSDSWGEDGYFRITRGQGTCGINTAVTSAVLR